MVLVVPEQSQRPYRFGMTLLCVGALFNWLGLADTYSDPVPAIRYIGVGLIAAGASLICMAMCFWMRNIHDPNVGNDYNVPTDPIHVITVDPALEKPPNYFTVVDVPPCYEDAIKLNPPSKMVAVHTLKHTETTLDNQFAGTNNASNKSTITNSERSNSSQSSQPCDSIDFMGQMSEPQQHEKCDTETFQNSSQNENALTKVLRKSIRNIRRLRNGTDGDSSSQSNGSSHTLENGPPDRVIIEPPVKLER